jgi:hypothetical protein
MLTYIATAALVGPSDDVFFTGTVIAGLVAALASLLGLVISKESKVSEFRQKWIDELRKDTASFLSLAGDYAADRMLGQSKSTEKINQKAAMIRLRLNLKEKDHRELLESIQSLRDRAAQQQPTQSTAALQAAQQAFGVAVADSADIAARILKREWNVVKRGELVYKTTLGFVSIVTLGLFYTAIAHYLHRTILWKPY